MFDAQVLHTLKAFRNFSQHDGEFVGEPLAAADPAVSRRAQKLATLNALA
jgi:hypothetical protein